MKFDHDYPLQKDLEIVLSKLKVYEKPSFLLEQYPTSSNIAAEWVWNMAMKGEVAGRTIADAGLHCRAY